MVPDVRMENISYYEGGFVGTWVQPYLGTGGGEGVPEGLVRGYYGVLISGCEGSDVGGRRENLPRQLHVCIGNCSWNGMGAGGLYRIL